MSEWRIRPLTPADLPHVGAIETEAFGKRVALVAWHSEFQNDAARHLVAETVGGAEPVLAGFISFWFVAGETQLHTVAVRADSRGRGVAQALMDAMLDMARRAGAPAVTLEVREGNAPAIRLYEKFGFVIKGRRKGYYPEYGEDALIMWLDTPPTSSACGKRGLPVRATVLYQREAIAGHFHLGLALAPSIPMPRGGQFVLVRFPGRLDPLLGRPFGVYNITEDKCCQVLELLYRVAGRGTRLLSEVRPGDVLEVMGPYGNGFSLRASTTHLVLVAGGMGMVPLTWLATQARRERPELSVVTCLGAKTSAAVLGAERLEDACTDFSLWTDDGTAGTCGLVTDALSRFLPDLDPATTQVAACGPAPMMARLAEVAVAAGFDCDVSLEERMACGMGACLGCAVALTDDDGNAYYGRVCKDGPVFDARRVVWKAEPT